MLVHINDGKPNAWNEKYYISFLGIWHSHSYIKILDSYAVPNPFYSKDRGSTFSETLVPIHQTAWHHIPEIVILKQPKKLSTIKYIPSHT